MAPPTANGNGHITPRPALSVGEDEVAAFRSRYEHIKYGDLMRNTLIEDVISRYEALLREHKDYVEQHQAEHEWVAAHQGREQALEANLFRMQRIMNRDPHILVLIDGDGMIFSNTFLQQGGVGGKQAATLLNDAINTWAISNIVECPTDTRIVVRVFANLGNLGEACTRSGIVESPAKVAEFARGFTYGNALFDFIDVGPAKDTKITELFKVYLFDYHCRQIILGCGQNDTYTRLLTQYLHDEEAHRRVTLLESTPLENDMALLPFPKAKFRGIFREAAINLGQDGTNGHAGLNATSGVFTPRQISPYPTPASMAAPSLTSGHTRTDSIASSANVSDSGNTWATVTSKNKHRPLTNLTKSASNCTSTQPGEVVIKRNRAGQRLEPPSEYDRDQVQHIKKFKACNQHYIGVGCCHYNAGRADKCPHSHHYNFTPAELKILRVVAKETPCKRGHECDDVKCIYGHVCPFPPATEGSMRGVGCLAGEGCRFSRSMHGMDLVPVKMVKAAGAF